MMNSKTIVSAVAVAAVLGLAACGKKEPAPVALPETPPAVDTTTVAPVTEVPASGAGMVHEHGSADLSIALDGSTLSVTLEAPLANFVSFEHAPETPEQKQALQDVRVRR